ARQLGGEAADVVDLVALADVVAVERHGTTVCYADAARRRRLLELDRHGTLLLALRWHETALTEARVRLSDGTWLRVEPQAGARGGGRATVSVRRGGRAGGVKRSPGSGRSAGRPSIAFPRSPSRRGFPPAPGRRC